MLITNGIVVQKHAGKWDVLIIRDGMTTGVEPDAKTKKILKEGIYDLDFNYLGTRAEVEAQTTE